MHLIAMPPINKKPIFVATHPRACSTAFERVFMTRKDLKCVHEPFGDAFYFGPERLSERYADDEEARQKSGFVDVTYRDIVERLLEDDAEEGKRLFIKDIAHYLFPPDNHIAHIAPSLLDYRPPTDTPTDSPSSTDRRTPLLESPIHNPTVIPLSVLRRFHFAFLIRHPRRAIPSYYRCTVPPLSGRTGFHQFMPSEAGYAELRRLFDYLRTEGVIGEDGASKWLAKPAGTDGNGDEEGKDRERKVERVKITVVDADELLAKPKKVVKRFCEDVGLKFDEAMLQWGNEQDGEEAEEQQHKAEEAFAKWEGFHDDALKSTGLKARAEVKTPTREEEDEEWRQKYGEKGQRIIRECVDANVADYEYLKSFAIKV
ncbi:uncharacterized protein CTHT_0022740 [Thermochaetoides thermophila DSM 1495]|uniref:Uncharacterized protein n=1 Tax=Chaetomium thermophilum (strain DSM 1495 / CBS 144.50 / IMI 039719) TaxID=759272 RepID=G0S4G6_CHATD|nr:hypothetical protein CTHT_0022740 [Thermochaetoides thermophila DSM 1495]EGS20444.1 hypothetical protein CTHT_0022740 [Thermochaetoides thermophila DSM 1495]